jgi:hypothetical protein
MSHFLKIFSPIFLVFILSACTISHTYGPYKGKVVDKETGEPIEGAVVFVRFFTKTGNPGGSNSHFADALEVLTDNNGEFEIPAFRVQAVRVMHEWESNGDFIIFEPGYGAFPGHRETSISEWGEVGFPKNKYVTIKLPKLKTREERVRNLHNLYYDSTVVPIEKQKIIMKLNDEESIAVGLSPRIKPSKRGK